jgi:WD40 repeat protein
VLTFPGHASDVSNIAFLDSETGYQVVTGDTGGVVRLWDLDLIGQRDELVTFRGHTGSITMFAFHPLKPLFASSSVDKTVRVWNMQTRRSIGLFGDRKDKISSVAFSPDGLYLASASKGSRVQAWQLESGEAMTLHDGKESGRVRHLAFSPNGKLLVGGSEDGQISIWSFNDGKLLRTFPAHTAKIQGLEFNREGTILVTSSEDTKIKLWQTTDWHLIRELIGHSGGVYEIGFSPDSNYLISASDDRTARIWSVASGAEVIKPIQHEGPVWAADFDVDGKTIATGDEIGTVQTWRFIVDDNSAKIDRHRVLRISNGPVWWVKFGRVGKETILGLCGGDRNIRIVNLARIERLFANPEQLQHEAEQQSGLQLDITTSGPSLSPLSGLITIPERPH